MEKFMYCLFICLFSIMIIVGINTLFIEFSLSTLALVAIDILVLVLMISNQRMKKKIKDLHEATRHRIKGSDLMVFVGGKQLAFAANHEIIITERKLLRMGTILNVMSWEMSSENLLVYDAEGKTAIDLYNVMITRQAVDLVFAIKLPGTAVENTIGLSVTEGSIKYQGKAFINSVNINAPNGDNVTFSVQLTGTGELKKVS